MRQYLVIIGVLVGSLVLVESGSRSDAATVTEAEQTFTATDNTPATAQFIPASAFTLPVSPFVFNPPGFPTASVVGNSGITGDPSMPCVVNGTCVLGSDLDWYAFYANGGGIVVDADSSLNPESSFHGVWLALFDDAGNRIATSLTVVDGFNTTVCNSDPGSGFGDGIIGKDQLCPFAGPFELPRAGNYFLTVLPFGGLYPDEIIFGVNPDGLGPQPENNAYGPREGYVVHISLERPIPFPATLWLLASGFLLSLIGRRLRGRA